MRNLMITIGLIFFQTTAFAKIVDCICEQNQTHVKLDINSDKVSSLTIYDNLPMRSISESLPAGIYNDLQSVNEQLNWYFEDDANLVLSPIAGSNRVRLQVLGMNANSNIRVVAFSKTLSCSEKFD